MHVRFVLTATLLAAVYGCATEPEPKQAGAAAPAAPAPSQSRAYRTGSRLPSIDDDGGSSTTGGMSKDDYINDRNATISPTRGN